MLDTNKLSSCESIVRMAPNAHALLVAQLAYVLFASLLLNVEIRQITNFEMYESRCPNLLNAT